MHVNQIATTDDPRIAPFRDVPDPVRLRAQGVFVAEGRTVVRRILAGGRFHVRALLVTPTALRSLEDILEKAAQPPPVYVAERAILSACGGILFHQGCLGLVDRPQPVNAAQLMQRIGAPRPVVALERVADPDNIGAIFRNAAAFGAAAVLLSPGCSDPLYRKAVRTSIGTTLAVPFAVVDPWPQGLDPLRAAGYHAVALTPAASGLPLQDYAPPPGKAATILMVGNEGDGLTVAALKFADARVRIPIQPPVNSLNAGTAAGIALYALTQ